MPSGLPLKIEDSGIAPFVALGLRCAIFGVVLVFGVTSFARAEEAGLSPDELELVAELGVARNTLSPLSVHAEVLEVQISLPAGYALATDVTSFMRVHDRVAEVASKAVRIPIRASSSPELVKGKIYYCGSQSTLCKLYQFEHTVPKGGDSMSTQLVVPPEKMRESSRPAAIP